MLLTTSTITAARDLEAFSWSGLQRFHDIAHTETVIADLHNVDRKQRQNARKQARQIRLCLMQAREYAKAAEAVSLVTRPVLAYYSLMSLALAEVLLKQSGLSSLDRARAEHRHHGLTLSVGALPSEATGLIEVASQLRALPVRRADGERYGTFDLWHRSCREMPVIGRWEHHLVGGHTRHEIRPTVYCKDVRLPLLPDKGIDYFDAVAKLPSMFEPLSLRGYKPATLLATVRAVAQSGVYQACHIMFANGSPNLFPHFLEHCRFDPNDVDKVNFTAIGTGGVLVVGRDLRENWPGIGIPAASTWDSENVYFWAEDQPVNEFGFFYLALYIAGNYARYYPDKWIADVEASRPIAQVTEQLLQLAQWRVPLLALSELSRSYVLPAA